MDAKGELNSKRTARGETRASGSEAQRYMVAVERECVLNAEFVLL